MSLFQAAVLGLVQGLTEFLPVSSSAHLVIFTKLFNLPADLFFDAMLHVATLFAVIVYFWREIISLDFRTIALIVIASIPTALMGILFEDYFEAAFSSLLAVSFFLFLTGVVILFAEKGQGSRTSASSVEPVKGQGGKKKISIFDALFIGVAQGCAIAPGLSRSGTTIAAALSRGLDRKLAARFSFLLSIPVILGAGLFQLKDVLETRSIAALFSFEIIFGMLVAFVFGYFAIKIFMQIIEKSSLRGFAYYVFTLAAMLFFWSIWWS